MTISNEKVMVQVAGDGTTTTFTYDFKIMAQSQAALYLLDADGNQSQIPNAGWLLNNAGSGSGGTFVYPRPGSGGSPAPVGSTLTLIRQVPYTQLTNLFNQGPYLPQVVENALDWMAMQAQQLYALYNRAIRVPLTEPPIAPLVARILRKNKVLGFDSNGNIAYYDVSDLPVPVTEDRMIDITASPWFAKGDWDGSTGTDNAAIINAAFAYANTVGAMVLIPTPDAGKLGFYISTTVTLLGGAAGMIQYGKLYHPGGGQPGLVIGNFGTEKTQYRYYQGLSIERVGTSAWGDEAEIGMLLRNFDGCVATINYTKGFCRGVVTYGDGTGFEDSTLYLGTHIDHKVALDIRTNAAGSWNNAIRYVGGHIAVQSATNPSLTRFGVRFSAEAGGYPRHNAHLFMGLGLELQYAALTGGAQCYAFHIQAEDCRAIRGVGMRAEQCGPYLCYVDYHPNDCVLGFDYVGTYGFLAQVYYAATVTRASVFLSISHQAAAAIFMTKEVLSCPNIRASAYDDHTVSTGGTGFEMLGVLSSNPSGPPTTLNGIVFPGLGQVGLEASYVQLATSRYIAAVFPCDKCKEFFVGVDGENLRLAVWQFDASENILGSGYPPLLSNANFTYDPVGTMLGWEMSTNLDQDVGGVGPLARLQMIRAHPSAAFIVIGVRGGDSVTPANNHLRGFTFSTSPYDAPSAIYGNGHSEEGVLIGRAWGSRYWDDQTAYDFPSMAAAATLGQEFVANGCRQGDAVSISYAPDTGFQNGFLRYDAVPGGSQSTNRVFMFAENRSGGTINMNAGTMHIFGTRPRK